MNVTARVIDSSSIADRIKGVRFQLSGKLDVAAGSHVTFLVPNQQFTLSRSYSVVEYDPRSLVLTIAVKLEPQSRGGSAYMCSLLPGDEVQIASHGNSMPVSYGARRYVLIAGGIGVTPMLSIARSLVGSGKLLNMHYAAQARSQAAFVAELHSLLGENLQFYASDLQEKLRVDAIVDSVDESTLVYVCGPLRLLEAVRKFWQQSGLPPENLRYETFANSGNLPPQTFDVVIHETGEKLTVPPQQSILDTLLMKGLDVMFDCRRGECGLCRSDIVSCDSTIDHRDVFFSESERASGNSLCLCVSRLSGGSARIRLNNIQHGKSYQAD